MPFGRLPPIHPPTAPTQPVSVPAMGDPVMAYFRAMLAGNATEQQGAQTDFDAAQKAYNDFIAANTGPASPMGQAQAEATQAGQQYQSAAAQPMPAFSPLDRLPVFFSQLGDIMGQTNTLAPAAEKNLTQQSEDHVKARQENLAAMKDLWEKKIAASEKLPPQVELEARQKLEQINKAIQQIHDLRTERAAELRDVASTEVAKIGADQRDTASLRTVMAAFGKMPGQGGGGDTKPGEVAIPGNISVNKTMQGDNYIEATKLLDMGAKRAAEYYSHDSGTPILNAKEIDELGEVQVAQANIGTMRGLVMKMLPPDWQSRPGGVAGITIGSLVQSSPLAAAWGALRETGVQQLRATAGVTGNRQADRQFQLIQKNDIAQKTDAIPVALARTDIVDLLVGARYDWLLNRRDMSRTNYAKVYALSQRLPRGDKLGQAAMLEAVGAGAIGSAPADKSGLTAQQKQAIYDRLNK